MAQASNIEELVINLTQHFTKILSTDERKNILNYIMAQMALVIDGQIKNLIIV